MLFVIHRLHHSWLGRLVCDSLERPIAIGRIEGRFWVCVVWWSGVEWSGVELSGVELSHTVII